jgi:hypothetical protein
MIKKILPVLILFTGIYFNVCGQIQSRPYPKNYFRYPLDLAPITAGSFGELRPNHFHSGLDFKTNQRTGYPVHAVFDGYVSRLRIQFGGFGHAIYITHPNGYTTVYGHIERFSPAMAKLIRDYQYEHQTFEADFKLDPLQMPVCKDDVIAWSGNEGASAGPHLHFEIRDTQTEETVNPQLFGLTIPDIVAPTLSNICVYDLNSGSFSELTPRRILPVAGGAGKYHLARPQTIAVSGATAFGISATDLTSVSPNHNGVYSIELKVDDKTVYTFAVEHFAFDQSRAINAYIDYPEFLKAHLFIQKCFILPGSKISLYPQSVNRGIINFNDDALHRVEYIVKDVAGNVSSLMLNVRSTRPVTTVQSPQPAGTLFHYDRRNEFNATDVKAIIMPGNLYDDLNFTYSTLPKKPGTFSLTHRIHNHFTPLHDNYDLWIKPDNTIGQYADKAVIVNSAGVCEGGTYQDGYIKTQASTFGDFFIKVDTTPPVIRPVNIRNGGNMAKAKAILMRMTDNLSGIKTFTGTIDGKWVLMEWHYKSRLVSYTFNNDIAPGRHILR